MALIRYIEEGVGHHLGFANLKLNELLSIRRRTGAFFLEKQFNMPDGAVVYVSSVGDINKVNPGSDRIIITGSAYDIHIDTETSELYGSYDCNKTISKRKLTTQIFKFTEEYGENGYTLFKNTNVLKEGITYNPIKVNLLGQGGSSVFGYMPSNTQTSSIIVNFFNEKKEYGKLWEDSGSISVPKFNEKNSFKYIELPSAACGRDKINKYYDINDINFCGHGDALTSNALNPNVSISKIFTETAFAFESDIFFTGISTHIAADSTETNYFTAITNVLDSDVNNLTNVLASNYKISGQQIELISSEVLPSCFGGIRVNYSLERLNDDVTQFIGSPTRDPTKFDRLWNLPEHSWFFKLSGGWYRYNTSFGLWETTSYINHSSSTFIPSQWMIFANSDEVANEYPDPPCIFRKNSLNDQFEKIEAPFLSINKTVRYYHVNSKFISLGDTTETVVTIPKFARTPTQTYIGNNVILISLMAYDTYYFGNKYEHKFELWKSVDNGLTFTQIHEGIVPPEIAINGFSYFSIYNDNRIGVDVSFKNTTINDSYKNIYFGEGCAVYVLSKYNDLALLSYNPDYFNNSDFDYIVLYTTDYGVTFSQKKVNMKYIMIGMTCNKYRKLNDDLSVKNEAEFLVIEMINANEYKICKTKDYFTTFEYVSEKIFTNSYDRSIPEFKSTMYFDSLITYTGKK